MLTPLTDLVGECGVTKSTKKKGTKKISFYWDETHQIAFDDIKTMVARDIVLAYPDFSQIFQLYTDASSKQLGAEITQNNRHIAFYAESCLRCSKGILQLNLNF